VLLDTNIPLLLSKNTFHLSSEIERLIPQKHSIIFLSASMKELDYLSERNNKLSREISFARALVEKFELIVYDPENIKFVDDKIVQFAIENKQNCVVVTNDNELKKKLIKNEIPIIFIRKKKYLELIGKIPY